MAYQYEYIDGQRVEVNVAREFKKLRADFKAETGCDLYVSSGTRTEQEQQRGYNDYLAGRTTVKWAKPTESSHCEVGPSGPRALDLRDSGADAGVTVKNTYRWNVLKRLGAKYGFTWGGWGVPNYEGWHWENHRVKVGGNGGTDASGKLIVDGDWGPATTRALQSALGVSADGEMGPITVTALQQRLVTAGHKIAVDGDMGPATIRALQTFVLGAKHADGKIGPQTITGLQRYLNSGGKFLVTAPGKLIVDGDWGPATTMALQKALGVAQDGQIGPDTTTALQKKLGIPVDGDWGPQTTTGLQLWLGVTPDGEIGMETTRALQTALNAGKKFTQVTIPAAPAPAPAATPRPPVYPGAMRGWSVPLASDRAKGASIDWFIVHHQGSTNDDEGFFKTRNSRGSCPTWQVKTSGDVVEFIPPQMKPSSSGEANGRSVAVETQNTTMAPDWGISDASHEAIAQLVAWVSQQHSIGGVPVNLILDRAHVFGDNEITLKTGIPVRATACPGPSMDIDRIVARARQIVAAVPNPEPDPDTVAVPRSKLQEFYDWLKKLLGAS
jgi:lysozyme family protein